MTKPNPINGVDIVALLREADEPTILRRLDEIESERDGLLTLLRAVRAKRRVKPLKRCPVATEGQPRG